jgi:four helix bundle protein
MPDYNLGKRIFDFVVALLKFTPQLEKNPEINTIRNQVVRSATSTGANYEEAQAAYSKQDFCHKLSISLKEIREINYWLRLIKELDRKNENLVIPFIEESDELMNNLGSILVKSRK